MKKCHVVYNPYNEKYSVVDINEDCFACAQGQGNTPEEAIASAKSRHQWCHNYLVRHGVRNEEDFEELVIMN